MSLFGKSKTDEEKSQELYEKYGLDIDNYDSIKIKAENSRNLKKIAQDLSGMGFVTKTMGITMSVKDKANIGFLSAIFQSNLILIRQNELIIRTLEKIAKEK